jgi:hypothetical protein
MYQLVLFWHFVTGSFLTGHLKKNKNEFEKKPLYN